MSSSGHQATHFFKYLYKSRRETKGYGLDTYAVHGGNLISIELHTLTHRERHEEKEEENKACSQRGGGEKVKDMLVHARKKAEDTLCREMCHFQHICDSILQQHHAEHFPEMISQTAWLWGTGRRSSSSDFAFFCANITERENGWISLLYHTIWLL